MTEEQDDLKKEEQKERNVEQALGEQAVLEEEEGHDKEQEKRQEQW